MTDFYSGFWGIYIAIIVIASLIGLAYLLKSQMVIKLKKGESADVLHHTWDGDLQEYNNPLPGWWVGLFVLTIAFAVGYLALYPGLVVFGNAIGWTSTKQYATEVKRADDKYAQLYAKFMPMPVPEVARNAEANGMGKRLFGTYCIQCHGVNAQGAKGFPNLTDNDWLYGGTPEKIEQTIQNGRHGQMPAFGAAFGEEKVRDVANYVIKISGRPHNELRAARGEATFKQVCAACHTPAGTGNQDVGAPNLTDKIWLYGGSEATIVETITNGRNNVMPAWKDFLGDAKVHVLAGYVYSLSHGNEAAK
ncbi:cytochrome c oxidase cbb3-type subunit 3 [Andreprevotia lacus DSM 23236]|jgi:cytochrome c oxidase cbb3-type subunit 3|uniref:Cbb3-type cytochrome c oxidase subunit n=1 Tax=Andreprevotia lacus DSM 23236 TaxID=1121001 RepID=A0A1W1XDX9_9NEIS|nr:cytochrome-c oxidase, cbb3-type subunit III [Andreprevotia lacus]SMC22099.1 cytochrome c oxidase cbb3-type subunit 3 [Andreprevotia lacus DSM 23236]